MTQLPEEPTNSIRHSQVQVALWIPQLGQGGWISLLLLLLLFLEAGFLYSLTGCMWYTLGEAPPL